MTGSVIITILIILFPYLIFLPLKWLLLRTNYLNIMKDPSFIPNRYIIDDLGDFLIWIPLLNYIAFIGLTLFWDRERFGFTLPDHKRPSKLTQIIFLLPKEIIPMEDKEKMGRISLNEK